MSPDSAIGEQQRSLLEDVGGGVALSLLGTAELKQFRSAIAALQETKVLSDGEAAFVEFYVEGEELSVDESAEALRALETLRSVSNGNPTVEQVQRMRMAAENKSKDAPLDHVLSAAASGPTGAVYDSTTFDAAEVGSLAQALQRGSDVPVRVAYEGGNGGHFLAAVDVRVDQSSRSFLIADPSSGRTAWVSEDELVSGRFVSRFELSDGKIQNYYAPGVQ